MRFVLCILSCALFLSCASRNDPALQDIIDKWTNIEQLLAAEDNLHLSEAALITAIDDFLQAQKDFQNSSLYRIYRAIPYSQKTERSFLIYGVKDFPEAENIYKLTLTFRESIVSKNMEEAREIQTDISKQIIQLLIIDSEAQRYISSSYLELLIALVFFIAIIILFILFLHRSLTTSLKRETEGLRFSHSYMLAQDEERARISRELHDTVIQDMRCVLIENEETAPKMADLIRKTREICNSLIPPDFRFNELPDALRQLCLDFNEKTKIECRAEIDTNIKLDFLTMEKRLQVYRIVQEALTNIEKHADAKEVIVTMRQSNEIIYIGIGDDGKGFISPLDDSGNIISGNENPETKKSHLGMSSMKERAAILGGRLKIVSEVGEGTLVCLEIQGKITPAAKL